MEISSSELGYSTFTPSCRRSDGTTSRRWRGVPEICFPHRSDEEADAGDKYFAAQFDEFCNTRDGRRLVRELGPEKALKQWKQKVARDKRVAATSRALAGARSSVNSGSAKAKAAARRAKAKAALAGGAVRLAAEKQKNNESGACVVS